jgi:23S rRNA (guanosine2251-2'-O)-methyltransferase
LFKKNSLRNAEMPDIVINRGDAATPRLQDTMPVVLILDRLRSAHNAGNIFRLAEATRAEKILACGYTPAPPHPKLAKTARGCDLAVPCEIFPDAASAILSLKQQGYCIYGVETATTAEYYWHTELKFPAALVLGNEALGISESALPLCDHFISLPALGSKNSINVGNCAAVVLFEALRQWLRGQGAGGTGA